MPSRRFGRPLRAWADRALGTDGPLAGRGDTAARRQLVGRMGSGRAGARPTMQGGVRGGLRRPRAAPPTPPLHARLSPAARPRVRRGRGPGDVHRRLPADGALRAAPVAGRLAEHDHAANRDPRRGRQRARPKTSIDAPAFRDDGHGASDWNGDHLGLGALADTSPGTDPHAAAEAADLRRAVSDAIGELPFKYRAAVVLRHVMGLDYAEAARALDLPLNTYKSHLLRGTKLLRESLAAELDAPRAASAGSNGRHRWPTSARRPRGRAEPATPDRCPSGSPAG